MKTIDRLATKKHLSNEDILGMVRHWFNCPQGGYLGSDYGRPDTSDKAILAAKCAKDIPILDNTEIVDALRKL